MNPNDPTRPPEICGFRDDDSTQAAWVSLDENDNNVSVLIYALVAAVRTLFPEACVNTLQHSHFISILG